MDRNQKILLAGLAVIAILFVVVVLGGTASGDGGGFSTDSPGWVEGIGDFLVGHQSFGVRDTTGCRAGDAYSLSLGDRCQITIAASKAPVRSALLVLAEGREARIELTQPGSVPQRATVKPGKPVELKVFEDGAKLALWCAAAGSGSRCVLRLRKPG